MRLEAMKSYREIGETREKGDCLRARKDLRDLRTQTNRMNDNSKCSATCSVEIYTDGGCEPNPGPGGYGAVLLHPKKRAETTGGFRLTTNNRMEIYAAIAGLEMLKQP